MSLNSFFFNVLDRSKKSSNRIELNPHKKLSTIENLMKNILLLLRAV